MPTCASVEAEVTLPRIDSASSCARSKDVIGVPSHWRPITCGLSTRLLPVPADGLVRRVVLLTDVARG